jgi:serine/threonine-protein kinase
MELPSGTVVDRYTVEGVLGRGGMATVYRVRHQQLGTSHALKVLALPKSNLGRRLLLEGQVQARLAHPNVVAVTDVIEVGGSPGLVMELVRGPSLEVVLRRLGGRLELPIVEALVPGILAGVAAAHAEQVVHRDLKPANILLSLDREAVVPKVSDFGLVKLFGDDVRVITRSGQTMGTPSYMAPEQVLDARAVDPRTDLFAIGAVLYEVLSGVPAHPGDGTWEVFDKVLHGTRAPLGEVASGLPDRVVAAVEWALTRDREQRVPTCEALWAKWSGGTTPLAEAAAARPPADREFAALLRSLEIAPSLEQPGAGSPATWQDTTQLPSPAARSATVTAPKIALGASVGCVVLVGLVLCAVVIGGIGYWVGRGGEPEVAADAPEPPSVVKSDDPLVPSDPVPPGLAQAPTEPVPPDPVPVPATPKPARPRLEAPPEAVDPPAASGTFSVSGDADRVVLLPPTGAPLPPGAVPAGTYGVRATFGGRDVMVGTVTIGAGAQVRWSCAAAMGNCAPTR